MFIEIRPKRKLNVYCLDQKKETTAFLIHGVGGSSKQWREQIPTLKEHYNLIVPDLLGAGESAKPYPLFSNPYSFENLSADLEELFTRYATEKNILIGHSYGGALAAALAFKHQTTINKLILISPVSCKPRELTPLLRWPWPLLEWQRPKIEKFFNAAAYDPSADPALLAVESKAGKLNRMYVIKALSQGMHEMPTRDVSHLATPTLIIMGETDKLTLPADIQQFYQVMPQVSFQNIQHAAHMVMLEKPEMTNSLVEQFLEENR